MSSDSDHSSNDNESDHSSDNSESDFSSNDLEFEGEQSSDEGSSSDTVEYKDYTIKSIILRRLVKALRAANKGKNTQPYFVQGTINADNVALEITSVGNISFPIKRNIATKLINIATLASFGHREQTKQDKNVRDTYMIPKEKLNVTIKNLDHILKGIKTKLSLNENSNLEAHLHNMLIYKQGQHFDYHQDTEKMDNMVATLVIVLPSAHAGGDLVIEHLNESHVFSSKLARNKCIKYIAFYSDCHHKVEKVKSGFRIVLTYNLILCGSQIKPNISYDRKLISVLKTYFESRRTYIPRELIYLFNHSYTEKGIKFANLKGLDMQVASALLSAARKLNLVVRLALADITESWDEEDKDALLATHVNLKSWRDENDRPIKYNTYEASDSNTCWLKKNKSFSTYKVQNVEYTGNDGGTEDKWYKRAAIILWPRSCDVAMQFDLNFNGELKKLRTLMKSPNNLEAVQNTVKEADSYLYLHLKHGNNEKEIVKTFVQLAIYLKNPMDAFKLCRRIYEDLFCIGNSDLLLELKKNFGSLWCLQFIEKDGRYKNIYSNELVKFIALLKDLQDRTLIEQILKKQIEKARHFYHKNEQFDRYGALLRAAYETDCFYCLRVLFRTVLTKEWDLQKLTQFYTEQCMGVKHDTVENFKSYITEILKSKINLYIRYMESGDKQSLWLTKVNFAICKCDLCKGMIHFLKSEDKEKEFDISIEQREHLLRRFEKRNKDALSMAIVRESRHVLVVRKIYSAVENCKDELTELEKLLQSITTVDVGDDKTLKSESSKRAIQEDGTEASIKKKCL